MPRTKEFKLKRRLARGSGIQRSEPRFLAIGQITKPHGVRGEVSVVVLTDFPERFTSMETVLVGDEDEADELQVASVRWNNDRVLMRFEEISDRTMAETLRGLYLLIPIEAAKPLSDGLHYSFQLIGLTVISDEGEQLGVLTDILETGVHDVYVVKGDQGEILLPNTDEVIRSVDLAAQEMHVHLIPGLI